MKRGYRTVLLVALVGLLAGCAPAGNPHAGDALADGSPAGFLLGLWHGFTILITFVASLFTDSVGIYEVRNTGWSYNLGYVLGVLSCLGGGGRASRSRKK